MLHEYIFIIKPSEILKKKTAPFESLLGMHETSVWRKNYSDRSTWTKGAHEKELKETFLSYINCLYGKNEVTLALRQRLTTDQDFDVFWTLETYLGVDEDFEDVKLFLEKNKNLK